MQFHRGMAVKQRLQQRHANARTVPRVRQAWMQHCAIGETGTLRHIIGTINKHHIAPAGHQLVKRCYTGQTGSNNYDLPLVHFSPSFRLLIL
jgi:3-deoxy-D-manno-octulosonic-acid transferase